jgi:hypothetical protein
MDIENSQLRDDFPDLRTLEPPEHTCNKNGLMGCCDICGQFQD